MEVEAREVLDMRDRQLAQEVRDAMFVLRSGYFREE